MSEEMKKGILDKEYSRRQFLKMSGKGLAGISMTAAMLSLFGCTQKQVEEGVVDLIATPTALLVANRAKCTGCQRCETNCTLTNDGKAQPYLARLRVRDSVVFGAEEVPAEYMHGGGFLGEVHRLRRLRGRLPLAYAQDRSQHPKIQKVHHLRRLRRRLPHQRPFGHPLGGRCKGRKRIREGGFLIHEWLDRKNAPSEPDHRVLFQREQREIF